MPWATRWLSGSRLVNDMTSVSYTHLDVYKRQALTAFEAAPEGETVTVTVCGRLLSVRDMGKSVFADVADESGRLQLFLRRDDVGEERHNQFKKLLDLGDFVQATRCV